MRLSLILIGLSMTASAAPRTLVVGSGECQNPELISGVNDFSTALRDRLKSDLYEPDVVLDIVRPRPTRSLEDIERQVESARTLFFNGQLERALDLLKQAISELERAPVSGQPWKVTAQAFVLQGVVLLSLGKKPDALEAFRRVLRVEPNHALNADDFAPSVIAQFEAVKKELLRSKKAALQVQSSPGNAEVLIDGRVMGSTPLKLELVPAAYRLVVRDRERVSFLRVIALPRDGQVQIDLASEGALATQAPLCLSGKDRQVEAAALKLANTVTADDLIVVRIEGTKASPGPFVASRYEIRSGSMVREGRVLTSPRGKPAFAALATFLLTGQSSSDLLGQGQEVKPAEPAKPVDVPKVVPAKVETKPDTKVETKPETKQPVKVAPSDPLPPPAPPAATSISAARIVAYSLMGAGLAAGVLGAINYTSGEAGQRARLASLKQADGRLLDPSDPGHREALNLIPIVDRITTVSFALIGAGIGLVGAGLVTFFVFPGETVAVSVVPGPSGGHAVLTGRF